MNFLRNGDSQKPRAMLFILLKIDAVANVSPCSAAKAAWRESTHTSRSIIDPGVEVISCIARSLRFLDVASVEEPTSVSDFISFDFLPPLFNFRKNFLSPDPNKFHVSALVRSMKSVVSCVFTLKPHPPPHPCRDPWRTSSTSRANTFGTARSSRCWRSGSSSSGEDLRSSAFRLACPTEGGRSNRSEHAITGFSSTRKLAGIVELNDRTERPNWSTMNDDGA